MRLGLIASPHPNLPLLRNYTDLSGNLLPSVDWSKGVDLARDALGNEQIGNCVECAAYRTIQMRRRAAMDDHLWRPTADMTRALYSSWAGYDAAIPTSDVGTRSDVAAQRWSSSGIPVASATLDMEPQIDIPAMCRIDPANLNYMMLAIAAFGPVQAAINLPMTVYGTPTRWRKFKRDMSGDAAPGSWGAHMVSVCGFSQADQQFLAVTWGYVVRIDFDFWAAYALDVEVGLSRQWIETTGLSPSGLDLTALESEMKWLRSPLA